MASIYQTKALRRLDSPEQLDKLIVVTPPMTWMVMAGAVLIVLSFLGWAFFGSISQSLNMDAIALGDGNDTIIAFVPVDEASEIRPGEECVLSVSLGAHAGMEFDGVISDQEIQIVSEAETEGILGDESLSRTVMKNEAMAAVYIHSETGRSLNKGELVRAQVIVSDVHPYQFVTSGQLQ